MSAAESTEFKEKQAALVSECQDLRKQVMKLSAELDESRSDNLAMERLHRNSVLEAEQRNGQLATSQLKAQHTTAVLQEKVRVMGEEMGQVRKSNARLVEEVHGYFTKSGRLASVLDKASASMSTDIKVFEQHLQNVQKCLEAQIDRCCTDIDAMQATCDRECHSVDLMLDGLMQVCED